MSTITTIQSTDAISASRSTINTNFSNLNTDKAELSGATFTGDVNVPDEAYGAGWNGSTEVPTKNAVYDKVETKQDTLVSWTNIKTINSNSILGSGDLTITASANIPVKDEGTTITSAVSSFNFVGSGVTATNVWNDVTVTISSGGGSGDVVWPASATDNAIARFDTTTGKLIQNSAATIADTTWDITAGKYNTVTISWASTPSLSVTGTTSVSGTNTGDQTTIVGITGTMAQFDTAVTDGNIVYQSQALWTPSSGTLTNCTGLPVSWITSSTTQALGVGSLEIGNASDTTLGRASAWIISVEWEVLNGYASTATAAGTTTLTVASARVQHFTGTTTQTVVLPTTSVVVWQQYEIVNRSTGLVTVQSSGLNTIVTLGLNQKATLTALQAVPTSNTHWSYEETNLQGNSQGKRLLTVTQSATPSINTNNGDIMQITGLAQAITSMSTNLTGNPVAWDMMMIQITDNWTARAITWGASYASTANATLPTTTVVSTMLRILFQRDNANTIWDCISVT